MQQRLTARGVERACARGRVEREAIHGGAQRLVVRERSALAWPEPYRPLRPGRRHLARDRRGSEARLGIAVEIVVLVPRKHPAAAQVLLDTPDGVCCRTVTEPVFAPRWPSSRARRA